MTHLTAADILAAAPPRTAAVEVEEWGGTVHVRELSAYDRIRMSAQLGADDPTDDAEGLRRLAVVVAWAASDPTGKPLFADPAGAVDSLIRKSSEALLAVAKAAMVLNGMRQSDDDAEAAEGN